MKIPEQLKIGGHIIRVDASAEMEGLDGEFDTQKNLIRICAALPQSQKEATLIHEIFHALNVTMDDTNHFGHALLASLSEQFYQVLKDNNLLND